MRKKTKYTLVAASLLLLAGFGIFRNNIAQVWADIDIDIFPTVLKEHMTLSDIDGAISADIAEKANVLFLVDTSNSMTFSSKGMLPDFTAAFNAATGTPAQKTTTAINATKDLVKQATFGIGARDASPGSPTTTSRAGRDVDSSNNDVGNPNCYYSPDPSKPYLLTFRPGNSYIDSATKIAQLNTWANSATLPVGYDISNDLMPNDSRLYQMKLVFWRILEEKNLFDKLRFALATTHVSEKSGTGVHVFYKIKGNNNWSATADFPYGTIYPPYTSNNTGTYSESTRYSTTYNQGTLWAISTTATNAAFGTSVWYTVKRAFLRVPFGESSDSHFRKFRTLIDGIENNNATNAATNPDFNLVNPELTTSGAANLATAIYPRGWNGTSVEDIRDKYIDNKLIYYSNTTKAVSRLQNDGLSGYHNFAKGSGEAAGTVLDFFSPPIKDKGWPRTATDNLSPANTPLNAPASNFPIRNVCENNWLIIFTSGDGSSEYPSHEAIRDLYNYTRDHDVALLNGSVVNNANLSAARLNKPIRTLVIGFIDPNATDSVTVDLKTKLNLMADYGDDGTANNSTTAEFANDVPGLIEAMRKLLTQINSKISPQSSGAAMGVDPQVAEDAPEPEAYSATLLPKSNDQWQGFLTRFKVTEIEETATQSADIDMDPTWELGDLMYSPDIKSGYATTNPGERRLVTWDFYNVLTTGSIGNLKKVPFPGLVAAPHALAAAMGLETAQLDGYTAGKPHPSNLMLRWLHGWDFQYQPSPASSDAERSIVRNIQLSDMGKGEYTLVGRVLAASIHAQPDYRDWTASPAIFNRARTLYIQSNGGMLHAVDVSPSPGARPWARERWAFIPPNVLANQRLAGLKFNFSVRKVGGENKQFARWVDGPQSYAGFTTDGGIRTQNLWDGSAWQTYLFGSMGRGGAGLYVMQITNPEQPQFQWAVENNMYSFNTNSNKGTVHHWTKNSYLKQLTQNLDQVLGSDIDYRRLGFNAPSPAIGTTLVGTTPTNVGILAGGMQYALDLTKNGTIGAALYIFDPITGRILKEYNAKSTIPWATTGNQNLNPKMGMMTTPPTLVLQAFPTRYATGFFAADNRGNIFEGKFASSATGSTFFPSTESWTFERVASLKNNTNESAATDNFAIPYKLLVARDPNREIWLFGGTADIPGRRRGEDLGDATPPSSSSIINKSQWLFGFKNKIEGKLLLREPHFVGATGEKAVGDLSADVAADIINTTVQYGWTIALQLANETSQRKDNPPKLEREYLSAPMLADGDAVFAAAYLPLKQVVADCVPPNPDGDSRVYWLGMRSGAGGWKGAATKYIALNGIKISGLSVRGTGKNKRLFIAMTTLNELERDKSIAGGKVRDGKGNPLESYNAKVHSPTLMSIGINDPDKSPIKGERLNYWREVYTR